MATLKINPSFVFEDCELLDNANREHRDGTVYKNADLYECRDRYVVLFDNFDTGETVIAVLADRGKAESLYKTIVAAEF